ncbi:hypothetical protein PYW07_015328 [Mythimna separata]|uniref:Larval cuticle protein 1-like n=1 Tax=Mythimna separata TaxID=271217 RepID=A0AAD7YXK2_MYTSE|nr:hypothetical protein PYW07_015328 [Mythimna separata]
MKSMILVALALVAVAVAAPAEQAPKVTLILRSDFEQEPAGGYKYAVETDDGTARQEEGTVKEVLDEENKPHNVVVVRGSFSYVDPEGVTQTINYIADENGFQPEGPSIPKAVRR